MYWNGIDLVMSIHRNTSSHGFNCTITLNWILKLFSKAVHHLFEMRINKGKMDVRIKFCFYFYHWCFFLSVLFACFLHFLLSGGIQIYLPSSLWWSPEFFLNLFLDSSYSSVGDPSFWSPTSFNWDTIDALEDWVNKACFWVVGSTFFFQIFSMVSSDFLLALVNRRMSSTYMRCNFPS